MYAHFTNDVYNFLLPPLLVVMGHDFGLTYTEGGLLVALYLAVSGLAQTPVARFAEKRGLQKQMLVAGFLLMSFSVLMMGISSNFLEFVLDSAVLGLALSPYHAQAIGALSSAFKESSRGGAVGLHQLGGNLGMIAAPLLVGLLFAVLGLSWFDSLALLALPAVLAALFLHFALRMPSDANPSVGRSPDGRKAALMALSVVFFLAIAYAFNAVATRAFSSFAPSYIDFLTKNVALSELLTSFVVASGTVAFPLGGFLSDRMGRWRVVAGSYLLAGVFYLVYSAEGSLFGLPLLFAAFFFGYMGSAPALAYAAELGPRGMANSSVALVFGAGTVGNAAGPFLVGFLIDRMGFLSAFRVASIFAMLAAFPLLPLRGARRTKGSSGHVES